jgi:hypothetical protein
MTTITQLKRQALISTRSRGHTITWHKTTTESAYGLCDNCQKSVILRTKPFPNEIDIGGAAVARGCVSEFTVEITVYNEHDLYPDTSWLGEFFDTPQPDSIKTDRQLWIGETFYNDSAYYVPMNSLAEARTWYTEHGYSKHDAYTQARAQTLASMHRLLDYHNDQWDLISLGAVVTVNGAEIGEDWIGGVESDSGDYLDELTNELIDNAIGYAEKHLSSIGAQLVIDWSGVEVTHIRR